MTEMKCVSCDEQLENDEFFEVEYGSRQGELVCAACYFEGDTLVTVLKAQDGMRCKWEIQDWRIVSEDVLFDGSPEADYIESIFWQKVDPWRGYYDGKAPEGWSLAIDTWYCPFDGHNIAGDLELFHTRWATEESNPPHPMIVSHLRGSNLMTMNIQVLIPDEAGTAWRKWLEGVEDA